LFFAGRPENAEKGKVLGKVRGRCRERVERVSEISNEVPDAPVDTGQKTPRQKIIKIQKTQRRDMKPNSNKI